MKKNKDILNHIDSNIDYTNHGIFNVVKIKKFPTYGDTNRINSEMYKNNSDLYMIYDLNKEDIGKYLNTWYIGEILKYKKGDFIITDEIVTVKKVNENTSMCLYDREYNPVTITIMCLTGAKFELNDKGEKLYRMKAQIHSIDDSSYGVLFDKKSLKELKLIRIEIMKWLNSQKLLDGDEFIKFCVSLGADEESIDYN